jgi:hypothetical protein
MTDSPRARRDGRRGGERRCGGRRGGGALRLPQVRREGHPRARRAVRRAAGGAGQGSVALSLCTTAHPLYTGIAKALGASISEATL